jgi:hypothetical protein
MVPPSGAASSATAPEPARVSVSAPGLGVQAWPVGLSAGLLLVAGIIHLVLVPQHLAEARGTGLYFCLVGAAQVIWALLFVLRPTRPLALVGLVAMAAHPIVLYAMTRILPAPFVGAPEHPDLIGIVTVVLEILAVAPFAVFLSRMAAPSAGSAKRTAVAVTVALLAGAALGAGLYGAGVAAENVFPWLEEGEAPHGHGATDHDAMGDGHVDGTHAHDAGAHSP